MYINYCDGDIAPAAGVGYIVANTGNIDPRAFVDHVASKLIRSEKMTESYANSEDYWQRIAELGLPVDKLQYEDNNPDYAYFYYSFYQCGPLKRTGSTAVDNIKEYADYYYIGANSYMATVNKQAYDVVYYNLLYTLRSVGLGERTLNEIMRLYRNYDTIHSHVIINVEGKTVLVKDYSRIFVFK
ncbi:hypothetical protein IM41_03145 [Fervidobacterium sp. SC_NGM5_G05]|nr:hypothetical protein IM41_03145 [Fervidobacterium sp. SC_NGM5_G05]